MKTSSARGASRPALRVVSLKGTLNAAVVAELRSLLAEAEKGLDIGFTYVTADENGSIRYGAAGTFARDPLKAAGAHHAAAGAALEDL